MLSILRRVRKSLASFVILAAVTGLAACTAGNTPSGNAGGGKVKVALLVPAGSGQLGDELLARSLQNAARMAIADLNGAEIDLRVYSTGGQPAIAATMAAQAVAEGAQIILGPVYAQEANAVGLAAADSGVSVMSFSNNTDIAGNNVFVLGSTFDNTARRLASYAVRQGKSQIMIVQDQNTAGNLGRVAIERGVASAGGSVVAVGSYEFSQNGVVQAAPALVQQARAAGAQTVFLTADTAGALPLISQMLMDNGLGSTQVQYMGLTRWDIPTATLALPGAQGGWFALPDPTLYAQYQGRYQSIFAEAPHPISGLAYDGIAAIGALAKTGAGGGPISRVALTQGSGFRGVNGIFRLYANGTNERGLAIAQVTGGQYIIIDAAPRSFSGAGF